MSNTIESILSAPDKKKETEHSLIISMSKDISRGYGELKKAVGGGGTKKPSKKEQTQSFIINGQLTVSADKREESRSNKRKSEIKI